MTYNLRTGLKDAPAKDVFMTELHGLYRFKFDVIGLCESRAAMETRTKWNTTGDEIYIGPGHEQQRVGGIGFIVSKCIANQIVQVDILAPSRKKSRKVETPRRVICISYPPVIHHTRVVDRNRWILNLWIISSVCPFTTTISIVVRICELWADKPMKSVWRKHLKLKSAYTHKMLGSKELLLFITVLGVSNAVITEANANCL